MFAEAPPPGFAFSDTAFRIFILMASRRLKSDRFFTSDYRPEVYTPEGMAWVTETDFRDVIVRHCPTLAPAMEGLRNPFFPWRKAGWLGVSPDLWYDPGVQPAISDRAVTKEEWQPSVSMDDMVNQEAERSPEEGDEPLPETADNPLRDIAFFRDVDERTLSLLEQRLLRLAVPAGGQLVAEGDESDALYIVMSGRLEIRLMNPEGDGRNNFV